MARAARAKEYLARLHQVLPEKKASHCIFVAEYFASFAEGIGLDHDDAVAAGLLHDFCRCVPKEELVQRARLLRLPVSEVQLERPVLLHGPVAAEECRAEFGISDEVYEAIYWHTTGRPGLGRMGQGLCVADFAEPTRKYPEAGEARDLLRKTGFDAALRYVAEKKVVFCRAKDVTDPNTEAFLIWLRRERA